MYKKYVLICNQNIKILWNYVCLLYNTGLRVGLTWSFCSCLLVYLFFMALLIRLGP